MAEEITNLVFLEQIKKGIQNYGVFLMAITDYKSGNTNLCYIYTIGHQESNRPDIIIPILSFDQPKLMSEEASKARIRACANMINYLVREWDKNPLKVGDTPEDHLSIIYKASLETEDDKTYKEKMIQATNYYGHDKYPVLVLTPFGYSH